MSAGSIIGGIIGAVIGYFAGGNVAAGWAIGSAIGGYVDPDQIKGPRLSDGQAVTSQEGIAIPFGFGTFPIGGNLVFAGELIEHEEKESGKGGPEVINYVYTRSYAVGICEGPITAVVKAWRNGKLVYDTTPGSAILGQNSKFLMGHTFYLGTETQNVDPTIEAAVGVGNSGPMRGLCYMVAEDEDLTEMGGAVAQWRFVVQMCGTVTDIPSPAEPTLLMGATEYRGPPAALGALSGTAPTLARTHHSASSVDGIVLACETGSNDLEIYRWNGTVYVLQTIIGTTPGTSANAIGDVCVSDDGLWVICAAYDAQAIYSYKFDGVSTYTNFNTEPYPIYPAGICFSPSESEIAVAGYAFAGSYITRYTFNATTGALSSAINSPSVGGGITHSSVDWYGSKILASDGTACKLFDDSSMAQIAVASVNPAGRAFFSRDGQYVYHHNYVLDGGTLATINSYTSAGTGYADTTITKDRGYLLIANANTACDLYSLNGSFMSAITAPAVITGGFGALFTGLGPPASWYPVPDAENVYVDLDGIVHAEYSGGSEVSSCGAYLDDIVANLCDRAGIEPTEYDVTDLSTIFVKGYGCAVESSAQGFIEPLTQAFFFDRGEWDKKIRFILRGKASIASLDPDDLVAMDGPSIVKTRIQEVELLRKVNVMSADPLAEFNLAKQSAERRIGTIQAKGESTVEIPMVLDADAAAQLADKRMKVAWAETDRFNFAYTLAHSDLTATDVITLTDKAGIPNRTRLNSMAQESGIITIEQGMKDRASTYSSTAIGVQNPNIPGNQSDLIGPTLFSAMALPPLRSEDNTPGLYVGLCGILDGWAGATLLMSVDGGVSYTAVLSVTIPTIMGNLTAGEDSNGEPIQVRVYGGILSSATPAQVAVGQNWSAIETNDVAEIISYETATQTGTKTYDLTDIARAVDETDYAQHFEGDEFMDLSTAYYLPIPQSLAGTTLYFKAVGFGVSADSVDVIAIPWLGVEYVEDGGEIP
jgi:hypothetical protein